MPCITRFTLPLPGLLGMILAGVAVAPVPATAALPSTTPAERDDARPAPGADPKVNGERGRALAFEQARWEEALPLLAAGDDAGLRRVAAGDLKVGESAVERLVAGHDWWDWAAGATGAERVRGRERAAYWYRVALPAVSDEPRRGELIKMIAAADADAEAFYAKLDAPRPVDPGHARLDRAALAAVETVPLEAPAVDKDTTFAAHPDGKPFALAGELAVTADKPVTLTFEAGFELRGGTIDLRRRGQLVAKGTADRPVVFRKVVFLQDFDASLAAGHAVFDECRFEKGGAWFLYHSSKWSFDDCVLYRCAFGRLTGVDYGFRLRRCALASMTLPEIAHDRREKFDHMKALRGEWNLIEACDFLDCTVPPTVAWCAQRSNFLGCRFVPGEAFDSAKDAVVEAHVAGTAGDGPEKAWAVNPPRRGKVKLSPAAEPFETTRFGKGLSGKGRPVPEVAVHRGRAWVVVRQREG